jgi:hypothetical protein
MYIGKQKGQNRFKVFEHVTEIENDDFEKYDIYSAKLVSKHEYGNLVKQEKIKELKGQLEALGVDLNALTQPQAPSPVPATQQVQQILNETEPTSETPGTLEDTNRKEIEEMGVKVKTEQDLMKAPSKVEKVINGKKTGVFFTMGELKEQYDKFHVEVEKEIQEIQFTSYDESGFILNMTEHRRDLPPMLKNGIPVRQVV